MAYRSNDELREGFWKWLQETPEGTAVNNGTMVVGFNYGYHRQGWDINTKEYLDHFLSWITPPLAAWASPQFMEDSDEGDREEEAHPYLGTLLEEECDKIGYCPTGVSFSAFTAYLNCLWRTQEYNEE